jgi:hypothetical protein
VESRGDACLRVVFIDGNRQIQLINCNLDRSFPQATLDLSRCTRLATLASLRCTGVLRAYLICVDASDYLGAEPPSPFCATGGALSDCMVNNSAPTGDRKWRWIQAGAPDLPTSAADPEASPPLQRARRHYECTSQRWSTDLFAAAGMAVASNCRDCQHENALNGKHTHRIDNSSNVYQFVESHSIASGCYEPLHSSRTPCGVEPFTGGIQ